MFFCLGTPYDINSIAINKINISQNRNKLSIAIIDDKDFEYYKSLINSGYDIQDFKDITNIDQIKDYDIVVCDIKGVGSSLSKKNEGGYVIQEIRKRFPEKYIIAYSASRFDSKFSRFFKHADENANKTIDSEEWTEILDRALEIYLNPKLKWYRIRDIMIKEKISLYDIFRIEQAYIKSLRSKKINVLNINIDSLKKSNINLNLIETIKTLNKTVELAFDIGALI